MFTVYTLPDCKACDATKRWLRLKGEQYVEKDARAHADTLQEQGFRSAPVVHVVKHGYEDIWGGYQPARLKAAILGRRI